MDNWKEQLLNAGFVLKGIALEIIESHCDSEITEAQERQRHRDIEHATKAFLELKQNDIEIYHLLKEYFDIDSINEAEIVLGKAKISSQIGKLREYMETMGMSSSEFRVYAKEHNLNEKLRYNSKLLDMTAEKLKSAIEKE